MGAAELLQELIQRIGLDQAELAERHQLLEWQDGDRLALNHAAGSVAGAQRDFIDKLYQHLEQFPAPSAQLDDAAMLQRLKQKQLQYYQQLWQGPYDDHYLHNRLRIGLIHHLNQVDLKWYLGAYRLYLHEMSKRLCADSDRVELLCSLLKAVFFDMTIAIDTYSAAQRKALEDSEARLARALRGANDGIWDWHVGKDSLYVSGRGAEMIGMPADNLGRTSHCWYARVHPDDLPGLRNAIHLHLTGITESIHHEYRIRRHDGEWLWVLSRGIAEADSKGEIRVTGSQTDISRRKKIEQELHHAARHDPLTGLANRLRLDELLASIQQSSAATAAAASLLFIDLDRFKLINDSFGHLFGDRVLILVGERLSQCLGQDDHLFRFGGDEFVVLLTHPASATNPEQVAQRILSHLHQPMQLDERTLVVNASIGIARLQHTPDQEDALQSADLALHLAKKGGKAQFAYYSNELQAAAMRQLELESALGQALHRQEFELHYQPIHDLAQPQARLVGVEALLRWKHNGHLIAPLEFIPSLEESGEIIAVGEWVLRQACQQTRRWQLAGHVHLYCSVNLSHRQLQQDSFVSTVICALRSSGLPATSLVLELTETQLMQDSASVLATLRQLAEMGVRLALDDFGTGYSSLSYLKRFPLHILKIDKSFIGGVPQDTELSLISRAIIGLGHSLGLEVIAEGVEHAQHLDFLREERCTLAQGYLFSPPCPAEALSELLQDDTWAHPSISAVFTPVEPNPLGALAAPG